MLYHRDNQFHICPYVAFYRDHGRQRVKYITDKEWWTDFVNRWWHHSDLSFQDVHPSQGQIDRLAEVNAADIPEGFKAEASAYVEAGVVLNPDNPRFSGFTESRDFSNALSQIEYEYGIEELMEQTAQAKGYKSADRCMNYGNSTNNSWKAEADAFVAWRDDMFATCYQIMGEAEAGARDVPTVQELLDELPEMVWPE